MSSNIYEDITPKGCSSNKNIVKRNTSYDSSNLNMKLKAKNR